MLTPEIQQYINQQRSAGISDAQIRQNLATQGWQQADLDQAFGVVPTGPAVPQAPATTTSSSKLPTWAKWLIGVVIFFFILPGLIWGGILGYGYWKYKQSGIKITGSGNSPQTTNSKKPLNCDALELNSTDTGKLSPTLPVGWPDDIPIYPSSKLLGSSSLGLGDKAIFASSYYCSKDDINKIVDYFIASNSGWTFTKDFNGSQSSSTIDGQSISLIGKKSGPDGVIINISTTSNDADTLIYEQYSGSKQP